MSYSLTNILTDLSYTLGEQTVPTSGIEDRKAFIQRTLEEVHRYADWDWAKTTATVALSNGIASLATTVQLSPNLDIRIIGSGQGTDHVFTQVPYEDQDAYGSSDYRYWLTGTVGSYVVNTSETDDSSSILTYRYDTTPVDLLNGASTSFPSSLTLAQGALRYHRAARDPEYDVSQDQAIFEKGLNDILADQHRSQGPRRAKVRTDVSGAAPGEIG